MDSNPQELEAYPLHFNSYVCNGTAANGKDVIVYIIDTGFDTDYKGIDGTRLELIQQGVGMVTKDETKGKHGTNVAALIGDKDNGIACQCTIAPLRHNCSATQKNTTKRKPGTGGDLYSDPVVEDIIQCCERIGAYHAEKHSTWPAIVNCSFWFTDTALRDYFKGSEIPAIQDKAEDLAGSLIIQLGKAIEHLVDLGMVVINAGGNFGHWIKQEYKEWYEENERVFPATGSCFPSCYPHVLNVGALDRGGLQSKMSGKGADMYWLLGVDIKPAVGDSLLTGTSFAAPFLSGIVACLLSSNKYRGSLMALEGSNRQAGVRKILDGLSLACLVETTKPAHAFRKKTIQIDA